MEQLSDAYKEQCRYALKLFVEACANRNDSAQRQYFEDFWDGISKAISESGELLTKSSLKYKAKQNRGKLG